MNNLDKLVDDYLQDCLSPSDRDQLVQLLRDDKQARKFALELDRRIQLGEAANQVMDARGFVAAGRSRRRPWRRIAVVLAAAAAIALAFFALQPESKETPRAVAEPSAIARVIGILQQTETGEMPLLPNQAFAAGESISVKNGIVGVATTTGVELILEQGTIAIFDSPTQVYVKSGKVSVRLPPKVTEFAVVTDAGVIVDRGTAFGLAIQPQGDAEVHVFAGKVAVEARETVGEERLVEHGNAIRMRRGTAPASIAYQPEVFVSQPRYYDLRIHNTGVELDRKQRDKHWKTTRPGDNRWHPTIRRNHNGGLYRPNDPNSSWIALSDAFLPDNEHYTFRTTFVSNAPGTARLQISAKVLADDTIESIRFDGNEIWTPGPELRAVPEPWTRDFIPVTIDEMIEPGRHTLEFVTKNYIRRQPVRNDNDTGFRAEFEATLFRPGVRFLP